MGMSLTNISQSPTIIDMSSLLTKLIVVFILIGILVLGIIYIFSNFRLMPSTPKSPDQVINQAQNIAQKTQAVTAAQALFAQKKIEGFDMSNGPCLAEEIITDWSVDIAHNPRTLIDNEPQNQCQNFINGKTHHFVELDENGNIIRTN